MNVLSFFSELSHPLQKECIGMWQKTWRRKGFEPMLVGIEYAKRHPYYADFTRDIHEIHSKIMEVPCRPYGMACYLRWLAYDVYLEEKGIDGLVFASDYDVMNANFHVSEVDPWIEKHKDKFYLYHGCTPCLVSAKKGLFTEFAEKIIQISKKNIDLLKYTIGPHYNDQEFIQFNRSNLFEDKSFDMETGHHYTRLVFDFSATPEDFSKKTIHFSHAFCDAALNKINVNRTHSEMNIYRMNFVNHFFDIIDGLSSVYKKCQDNHPK